MFRSGVIVHEDPLYIDKALSEVCTLGNLIYVQNKTRDVDPDWLYPDPDPQNLINPDQGQ